MDHPRDYYEVLEVHPKARLEIIEKAYRVLARHYHPDLHPAERQVWAEAMMKELNEAYQTLKDPERRAAYDLRWGRGKFTPPPPADRAVKCFNHPKVPHVTVCTQCQRPICAACAIELWDRLLCLGCAATLQAEREAARAGVTETVASRLDPPMGVFGLLAYSVLWIFCLWGAGFAVFRLIAVGRDLAAQNRFFACLTGLTIAGVLAFAALLVTTRGTCRECGTVNSLLSFRLQAPWSEFWEPATVCRACGCVMGPGEMGNAVWEWLRRARGTKGNEGELRGTKGN